MGFISLVLVLIGQFCRDVIGCQWTWRDNQQPDSCHKSDYTLHQRYFWDYSTDLTTLRHPCSPQTNHYSTTPTDQHQGQRPTSWQTVSGVPNQVYWLSGYLYWDLKTRLTEHKWATKNGDIRNHISEPHRLTKHKIDWDSAEYVTYSTNYQQWLTTESWYTNSEQEPLNRCQQLPAPYKQLIHDLKRNQHTIDGSKITATTTDQSLQLSRSENKSHLTYQNQDQRNKYHNLMTTLHLTPKMTTAQTVETSVTNNSLSKDYCTFTQMITPNK